MNSFPMSRSEYLSEDHCRCGKYLKEVQRDCPCINITLHSDCKTRSNQYLQKEIILSESKPVLRNTEDLSRTYSVLPNRRYDRTGLNTEDHSHLSQSFGTKYERKYDRSNEASVFNNVSRIPYTSTPLPPYHSIRTNEVLNVDKALTDPVKRRLTYSKDNEESLSQAISLQKETSISRSMHQNKNPMGAYKEFSSKTLPVAKLGNSIEVVSERKEASTRFRTDLLPKLDKADEAKEDSSKAQRRGLKASLRAAIEMKKGPVTFADTDFKLSSTNTSLNSEVRMESLPQSATYRPLKEYSRIGSLRSTYINNLIEGNEFENTVFTNQLAHIRAKCVSDKMTTNTIGDSVCCSTLNTGRDKIKDIKFTDTATTGSYLEARKDFHCSKPEAKPACTVDTTSDTLQNILQSKRLNDKTLMQHRFQHDQCLNVKCQNIDCGYRNAKTGGTVSDFNHNSLVSAELLRMLMEIKEHTRILEEQLMIMNRNIRIKRKANEKLIAFSSPERGHSKQQRDIITQEPEKENVCTQEPSHDDINYIKCVQDTPAKCDSNSESREVKNRDTALQKSDKKRVYIMEDAKESKNYKEQFVDSNTKSSVDTKSQIHHRYLKHSNVNNLSRIPNVPNQCVRSTSSFTFNHSNPRPIAASTPKRVNLPREKETLRCMPCCKENNSLRDGNLQLKAKKTRLNELICCPLRKKEDTVNLTSASDKGECSTPQEKTIVMLLLTRGVNNTHLKSKYKKLEFTNFRPKCIIDLCTCDRESVKCRSSRRKVQIPTVFRQLKSVTCKAERYGESVKGSRDESAKQATKGREVSDLLATVCTQSSNLYITTATSISCVTFNNREDLENYSEVMRPGACILS